MLYDVANLHQRKLSTSFNFRLPIQVSLDGFIISYGQVDQIDDGFFHFTGHPLYDLELFKQVFVFNGDVFFITQQIIRRNTPAPPDLCEG